MPNALIKKSDEWVFAIGTEMTLDAAVIAKKPKGAENRPSLSALPTDLAIQVA